MWEVPDVSFKRTSFQKYGQDLLALMFLDYLSFN